MFVFTNKRLILIDKQGAWKRLVIIQYHKVITHFKVETAGTFDMDAELKLWISGKKLLVKELLMWFAFKKYC